MRKSALLNGEGGGKDVGLAMNFSNSKTEIQDSRQNLKMATKISIVFLLSKSSTYESIPSQFY